MLLCLLVCCRCFCRCCSRAGFAVLPLCCLAVMVCYFCISVLLCCAGVLLLPLKKIEGPSGDVPVDQLTPEELKRFQAWKRSRLERGCIREVCLVCEKKRAGDRRARECTRESEIENRICTVVSTLFCFSFLYAMQQIFPCNWA